MLSKNFHEAWLRHQSKYGDAIVSLSEDDKISFVCALSDRSKFPPLERSTYDLPGCTPGLHYATILDNGLWSVCGSIFKIEPPGGYDFGIKRYNFELDLFITSGDSGFFDPFALCAIRRTRDEYISQDLALSMVGHRFITLSMKPSEGEILETTWVDPRTEGTC